MEKFEKVKIDIVNQLLAIKYKNGDLSDIGNEIGIILGEFINKNELGCDLDDFLSGLNHGISLTNGTHG